MYRRIEYRGIPDKKVVDVFRVKRGPDGSLSNIRGGGRLLPEDRQEQVVDVTPGRKLG